jgi:hypothetical protein
VILARGLVAMGEALRPLAQQVEAAPPESAGGAPLGRLPSGLWQQAAPKQRRHLGCIARGVCRLAAVEGLHVEGGPQANGKAFWSPESRAPGLR